MWKETIGLHINFVEESYVSRDTCNTCYQVVQNSAMIEVVPGSVNHEPSELEARGVGYSNLSDGKLQTTKHIIFPNSIFRPLTESSGFL